MKKLRIYLFSCFSVLNNWSSLAVFIPKSVLEFSRDSHQFLMLVANVGWSPSQSTFCHKVPLHFIWFWRNLGANSTENEMSCFCPGAIYCSTYCTSICWFWLHLLGDIVLSLNVSDAFCCLFSRICLLSAKMKLPCWNNFRCPCWQWRLKRIRYSRDL